MVNSQDFGKIATALGLFASSIKSGEEWSPACETAETEAYDALSIIGAELERLRAAPANAGIIHALENELIQHGDQVRLQKAPLWIRLLVNDLVKRIANLRAMIAPAGAQPSEEDVAHLIYNVEGNHDARNLHPYDRAKLVARAVLALPWPKAGKDEVERPAENDPRISAMLRVGFVRFHAGVKTSTVQGAIDRALFEKGVSPLSADADCARPTKEIPDGK